MPALSTPPVGDLFRDIGKIYMDILFKDDVNKNTANSILSIV